MCAKPALLCDTDQSSVKVTRTTAVAVLARLVINIGHRMIYPFLPAIARGLGIPLRSAGILVTVLLATGLLSPLFGPFSDRLGRRQGMVLGMLLVAAGAVLVVLIPDYPTVTVGFMLLGLGKVAFDPSLRAFLGDSVSYERRGRALAVVELSWAGGLLVGAPLAGQMMERWGWRSPFAAVSLLAVIGAAGLLAAMPRSRRSYSTRSFASLRQALGAVLSSRSAAVCLVVTWLIMVAHELLFVVYGMWMESSFGLTIGGLGLTAVCIGVAELSGELSAGIWVDRLGKKKAVGLGLVFTALIYAVWPLVAADLTTALACLFALLFCFEFTFVATLPLVTELVPEARATAVGLNGAADNLGRSIGALLALPLWSAAGLVGNGVAAGAATLLAAVLLGAYVKVDDTG